MMRRQRLSIVAALVLAVTATATAIAQDAPPSTKPQVRPDGSVVGTLGGETLSLGTYHALLIGINDYQHTDFAPKLRTAVRDVETLARTLTEHYGFKTVRVVRDREASRSGILRALAEFRDAPLGPNDNFLIYYAGHGHQRPDTEDGFWIPADATADEATWISVADIRRIIRNVRARHTLLMSDSCFSGTLSRTAVTRPVHERFIREVFLKPSFQVITSGGLEPVADGGRDGLSLFAYTFINYLRQQQRPYLTASQIYADVAPLVSNASGSQQTPEHGKIPGTFDQNGEFVFARTGPGAAVVASLTPAPSASMPEAAVPNAANLTRFGTGVFVAPASPWVMRPEKLDAPGSEQLPFHLSAKAAQFRITLAPMGAMEMAKDPKDFREDILSTSLETFRKGLEKAGARGWKSKRLPDDRLDGSEMSQAEASIGGVWMQVAVVRNDGDGRLYMFMLTAPERHQSDIVAEYRRVVGSWKWAKP